MRVNEAGIQRGNAKLIHIANLQCIHLMFDQIERMTAKMDDNSDLHNTLSSKVAALRAWLKALKPKTRKKRPWEGLGSAIKWLAGNADADDLRDIQENFRKIEEEQSRVFEAGNLQLMKFSKIKLMNSQN